MCSRNVRIICHYRLPFTIQPFIIVNCQLIPTKLCVLCLIHVLCFCWFHNWFLWLLLLWLYIGVVLWHDFLFPKLFQILSDMHCSNCLPNSHIHIINVALVWTDVPTRNTLITDLFVCFVNAMRPHSTFLLFHWLSWWAVQCSYDTTFFEIKPPIKAPACFRASPSLFPVYNEAQKDISLRRTGMDRHGQTCNPVWPGWNDTNKMAWSTWYLIS